MTFFRACLLTLGLCTVFLTAGAQQTQIEYLSGTDKDHRIDWEFKIDKGRKSGEWTTIPVPSNWELEGFGVYNYGHNWRKLLPESDATGSYRHAFTVPAEWKNKTVDIVFEGSMTDTKVTINGKPAGPVHQGSFYRFKYEISKLLQYGQENVLEVAVNNVSANESVNKAERDADFWVFGGIYRPVYLQAHPKEYIDWTAIDAQAEGSFAISVYPKNIKNAYRLEAQIFTLDNQPVGEVFSAPIEKKADKTVLTQQIKNPKRWTPEFPNLYQVEVRLKNGDNEVHVVREKFGFRTVELRAKDGFYVNGQKVRFKGVNRHSAWPTSGRTLSKDLSIRDVNLMKEMNMNAVRMSHYPPDVHFLEACDSLGLFVIDELTGWQDAYDTEVGTKLVKELVTRDVNHPSIVMWANGNEGGHNYELTDDYARYDPQDRTVIHPWNILGETNTLHYPDYGCCANTLFQGDKIFFPTELLHGLYDGGHGAGLDDFWNAMLNHPLSAGGFLWVFADEGIVRTDQDGKIDVAGIYAPDGIVGPYREKEGSFYAIKEIWSPVYVAEEVITPAFNGKLTLENRYHFTDLNQCTFAWQLVNFPMPDDLTSDSTVYQSGPVNVPSIAPDMRGTIDLELPDGWEKNDALYLTATDPHGKEIFTWTWPLKTPAALIPALMDTASLQAAIGREDEQFVYLSANGVEVKLKKQDGMIAGVQNERTTISFANGPQLAAGENSFKSLRHYQEGNDYVAELTYEGILKQLTYRMMGNGWLRLDYTYFPKGEFEYMGINFSYPEDKVKGVRWLGNGPYRVWKNRMKGPYFGVHQKDYNTTVTGGKDWIYPEFKGYHDRMFWAVIDNEEYPFTVVSATDHIFMRLFTPDTLQEAYNENTAPAFPEGDISFMDAISPIGTKFKKPGQTGPSGRPNQFLYRSERERIWGATLYFDFGAGINNTQSAAD